MNDNASNTSVNQTEPSRAFLDEVYSKLGLDEGELWQTTLLPAGTTQETSAWIEIGDWLALGAKVGAERLFFVKGAPVIVFCQRADDSPETLRETFREVWCMARPQYLFIATPGKLQVFSLNDRPARNEEEWKSIQPLDVVHRVAEVSQQLHAYRREQIETGKLYDEKAPGPIDDRADKRLILDLKTVRKELLGISDETPTRYIYALIARSIFVRYLEDRGILTLDYFKKVASNSNHAKWSSRWLELLETPEERDLSPGAKNRHFTRVLLDKDFTYALFEQLAEHFNGDMFPRDPDEEAKITADHLRLLRNFFLGDMDPQQPSLFLWAYDFEIVPIELISSIYEEFYHTSTEDSGTHYTPSALVEYVLSSLLTPERLSTRPRILDFACGSAIFLVQTFRRIVRYYESIYHRTLEASELRAILRDQLVGIEINEEAIRVAAFSLYLALLHYQEPKSILAQIEQTNGEKPLPHLIYDSEQEADESRYRVLYRANSFSLMAGEREFISYYLKENARFEGRVEYERLYSTNETLPLEQHSFDIVLGNPPWGYLKRNEGTAEMRAAQKHVLRWCDVFGWSIGDKELSQAFIARALQLVKHDGECGLLVSAGVFLKRHRRSRAFRERWLTESIVLQVTNFTHVRETFFNNAISPFCFVRFKPGSADPSHHVEYWSAKQTNPVGMQVVSLSFADIHRVRQIELKNNDLLWKTYWWGNHRDAAFINSLNLEERLLDIARERGWSWGRGFERDFPGGDHKPSEKLQEYQVLPTENFTRYGPVTGFESVPEFVHRHGTTDIYEGWRLLVKRGITQADNANGRIEARLEYEKYAVLNSIHGIRIENASDWERKLLIGILWSSLARYYFFMTTSSWGSWHHEIHLEDGLLSLPIRLTTDVTLRNQIVEVVGKLQSLNPVQRDLLHPSGLTRRQIEEQYRRLEQDLDELIFDLYDLMPSERDLILDMTQVGLELFYRKGRSNAVQRVQFRSSKHDGISDLTETEGRQGLEGYLHTFLSIWNTELEAIGTKFHWRILRPNDIPMLAVVFTIQENTDQLEDGIIVEDTHEWYRLLDSLEYTLREPITTHVYVDGMVRAVTDTNVVIIKRDELRLWTRSQAREDADATLMQTMMLRQNIH